MTPANIKNKKATIVGGGVIGGGWVARFLLNGWDVCVYDPDPQAQRKIEDVLSNARRALPSLYDQPLPAEGTLSFTDSMADAVADTLWVQESVPERLALKQKVFADIQANLPDQAILASSTSGFKPSELQAESIKPEQILVCHPFNPVYLLPLVEVVGAEGQSTQRIEQASEILTSVGMAPLVVRKEIDAHIADRLLEAVWRESLWLVNDNIATTEEIDNCIRYGFGLRWAQMGLFETYRVAGGEAGMAHFISQFGPALQWPWTKLMDVPELTDELVQKIADQSDDQSGALSIRELERLRDTNLVAMMRALKAQNAAVGELLNQHDQRLITANPKQDNASDGAIQPVVTLARSIPLDWTDYNGHMNEARYLDLFSKATDELMRGVGCDEEYIAAGNSYFTVETHIRHIDEVNAGEHIEVHSRYIGGSGKKLHLFHELKKPSGELVATGEHMLIHVSLETRRSSEPTEAVQRKLVETMAEHAKLPAPDGLGRGIGTK